MASENPPFFIWIKFFSAQHAIFMGKHKRYWEIDAFRGTAIVSMVILHALVDLFLLGRQRFNLDLGLWYIFQKITITLFMLLVGISISIKSDRIKSNIDQEGIFRENVKRGIQLTAWGMLITFSTRIFLSKGFVVFGVLHCIGLSTIIITPFLSIRHNNLFIGGSLTLGGILINQYHPNWSWLLCLGLAPRGFYSVDYVPLLPWFGIILIGLYMGLVLYPNGQRVVRLPDRTNLLLLDWLSYLGKHSLFIYLVHQPLILIIYKLLRLI